MKTTKGKIVKPHLVLIYGPDGVGKSTFASEANNPIFIGPESGSNNLDVERVKDVNSWETVRSTVKELADHSFGTVVLDSLDWIEPLLWQSICLKNKVDTISDALGGYGKGYALANEYWRDLITDLNILRDKGMNIIIIAHSQIKVYNDPSEPLPYDRHQLKLNDKASAIWREYVDSVLFANFDITTFKVSGSDRKVKAVDAGPRKLFTVRTASFDAKNRLGLPASMPLSYAEFDKAVKLGQPDSLDNVKKDLVRLSSKLEEGVRLKMMSAVEKAGKNITELMKIKNHTQILVGGE